MGKAGIGDVIWTVCPQFANQQSAFNKVSLANAALTALRLHQRLPVFTLPCEFLSQLFVLWRIFSFVLLSTSSQNFLITVLVVLYNALQVSSYCLKLLEAFVQNSWWSTRFLISLVHFQAAKACFLKYLLCHWQ